MTCARADADVCVLFVRARLPGYEKKVYLLTTGDTYARTRTRTRVHTNTGGGGGARTHTHDSTGGGGGAPTGLFYPRACAMTRFSSTVPPTIVQYTGCRSSTSHPYVYESIPRRWQRIVTTEITARPVVGVRRCIKYKLIHFQKSSRILYELLLRYYYSAFARVNRKCSVPEENIAFVIGSFPIYLTGSRVYVKTGGGSDRSHLTIYPPPLISCFGHDYKYIK